MSNGTSDREPVPSVYVGPEGWPGDVLFMLAIDGETFAIRTAQDGGTYYDWITGRNQGYGFSSSAPPDQPEEEHRRSIRNFLHMIDPATGYITED